MSHKIEEPLLLGLGPLAIAAPFLDAHLAREPQAGITRITAKT
jgi:hypothetical protein